MKNKKGIIITLLLVFLLVGGAGGYLLWRVNQKETVAPIDSDAGHLPKECLDREIKVTLLVQDSQEGSLTLLDGKEENEVSSIEQIFRNSCDTVPPVRANPKKGYKFLYWDDALRKRTSSKPTIQLRYRDYTDQNKNTLKAVFERIEESEKFTVTYTAVCPGYKGEDVQSLLTCSDPSGGSVSAEKDCLSQKVGKGETGKTVYVVKPTGEECVFKGWELEGGKDLGDKPSHTATDVEGNLNIKAIFNRIYTGKDFSLKYSSRGEGDLKVDESLVKAYPVVVKYVNGQPYPNVPKVEAVAKEGWVFDHWESNIRGLIAASDRTKNPRHDVDRRVDLDIIAIYKKKGGGDPVKPDLPEPPEPPEKPNVPEKPVGGDTGKGTTEKMPQTSAFSDKSLYIITVGTLILCLGMVWQYIPKDIFKKFGKKK